MRKILIALLLLIGFASQAQNYTPVFGRWEYQWVKVDSGYRGPQDTLASAPIGSTAVKGSTLYIKLSTGFWTAITGAGGSGVWGSIAGTLSAQIDLMTKFGTKYDTTVRKLDTIYAVTDSTFGFYINGQFRTFKARGAIPTFNGRSGGIVLTLLDVTTALGYTPSNLPNVTNSLQVINAGNTVSWQTGLYSARPAAGNFGTYYTAIDSLAIYFDNGIIWLTVSKSAVGVPSVFGRVGAVVADSADYNKSQVGLANVLNSLQIVNTLGTPSASSDIFANRPAAGTAGRLFVSTDTHEIYRDNGTSWDKIGSGAAGGVTTYAALTDVNLTSLINGQIAQYNTSSSKWVNITPTNATVGLGNVPNVDATNAANIASGTLPAARIGAASIDLTTKVTGLLPDANIASAATWNAKEPAIAAILTPKYYYNGYKAFVPFSTDSIPQGATNKYFVSADTAGLSSKEPGVTAPNTTNKYWNGYKQFVPLNTDSIAEGTANKFFHASDTSGFSAKVNYTDSNTIYQTKYRSDSARANLYAALAGKVANLGASTGIKTGLYSARPSASNCQCYYGATDSAKWYYDNGSWITMGGGSGGSSGLNQLTGDVIAGPGTGSQPATVQGLSGTYAGNHTLTMGSHTQTVVGNVWNFDSLNVLATHRATDTIYWFGDSYFVGYGASDPSVDMATLTSLRLQAIQANHAVFGQLGQTGAGLYIDSITDYNAATSRVLIINWGTNDVYQAAGGTPGIDTADFKDSVGRWMDSAIIKHHWPASKIVFLSIINFGTAAGPNSVYHANYFSAQKNLCIAKGATFIDMMTPFRQIGGTPFLSGLMFDAIHPNDRGHEVYSTVISAALGYKTIAQGQGVAVNGLIEANNITARGLPYANVKSTLVGVDTAGRLVQFNQEAYIPNSLDTIYPGNINIAGDATFGGEIAGTALAISGTDATVPHNCSKCLLMQFNPGTNTGTVDALNFFGAAYNISFNSIFGGGTVMIYSGTPFDATDGFENGGKTYLNGTLRMNSTALATGTTTDSVIVVATTANVATYKKVAQSSIGGSSHNGVDTVTFLSDSISYVYHYHDGSTDTVHVSSYSGGATFGAVVQNPANVILQLVGSNTAAIPLATHLLAGLVDSAHFALLDSIKQGLGRYATFGGGFANPMTNVGDLILGGTAGAAGRLGIGTNTYVLTSNGTTASWQPAAGGGGTPANPTASIGLSAVNGSATTYMRSDAAPALSQSIVPTWTGAHTFSSTLTAGSTVNLTGITNATGCGGCNMLVGDSITGKVWHEPITSLDTTNNYMGDSVVNYSPSSGKFFLTNVSAKSYTATLTNTTNVSSSTLTAAYFSRNGNIVHVRIIGSMTVTSATSFTLLTFTLPFTTTLTAINSVGSGIFQPTSTPGWPVQPAFVNIISGTEGQLEFYTGSNVSSGPFTLEFDYSLN